MEPRDAYRRPEVIAFCDARMLGAFTTTSRSAKTAARECNAWHARGARNLMGRWGGVTPLMIAAQNHLAGVDSVQLLLRHGADINAQDDDGRRVVDLARSGSREVERLVTDVYLAGSFKRYLNAPRRELLGLRTLVARGRAAPKEPCHFHARLFGSRLSLPDHLFWKILSFWASSRDL